MAHKILATAVLGLALGVAVSGQPQPRAFFKDYARLSDSEIQKIEQGQVVTKVLGSTDTYGMLVFGAVYINAPIEKFAASFRDVKKLKENKVYLDVQEFSPGGAAPKLFDFERLVLDKKDVDELHTCKPGECDKPGFFLIEMNDSRLPDFGGLKLAVVRKVATGKGVESTKDTLSMFLQQAQRQVTGESQ